MLKIMYGRGLSVAAEAFSPNRPTRLCQRPTSVWLIKGRRKSSRNNNSTAAAPNAALQTLLNTIREAEEESRINPQLNLSILGKRTRDDGDGNSDGEGSQEPAEDDTADNASTAANPSEPTTHDRVNQNIATYARNYASRHGLPPTQVKEVEEFSQDSEAAQRIKSFVRLLVVEKKLDQIVKDAGFEVPTELKDNTYDYAEKVLLSADVAQYRGDSLKVNAEKVIRDCRWGLPPNIENNHHAWKKVRKMIDNAFTHHRSEIKKKVRNSMENEDPAKCWSIIELTEKLVAGRNIEVSWPLCGRVALMRATYLTEPGDPFWDVVDDVLSTIRSKKDDFEVRNTFAAILDADRKKYGQCSAGDLERLAYE